MRIDSLRRSALVKGALEARRPTRWWIAALLILAVAVILVGDLIMLLYDRVVANAPGSVAAQAMEFFTNAGALLALWLWLRFKEKRAFSSVGFRSHRPWFRFLIGVGIGAGMISLVVACLVLLGQYQQQLAPPDTLDLADFLVSVPLLMIVWTIQGSTEETLMRGYLLQTAATQLPGWLAILLPGALFSAMHFVGEGPQVIAGVNILLFALFVSFVALRQGSIWMVCGIHAGWNGFQGNVFTLPVSGNVYTSGFFHYGPTERASTWLAGGDFGPENSVVVTIVWGIAALLGYLYFVRKPKTLP